MRIALICGSNLLFMPYLTKYINILDKSNIEYDIINWDRFNIEEIKNLTFKDEKIGHRRNFIDYLKYKNFVVQILDKKHYDRLIIFGIQLVFFLKKILIEKYKNKYILDIRDYHILKKIMNFEVIIENSYFVVLSSPEYKLWLPMSNKYVVNHNTNIKNIDEIKTINSINNQNNKIVISCIGAIRDYKINVEFIHSLRNSPNIIIYYHGIGDINDFISKYLKVNNITNVIMTGMYKKEDEQSLYLSSSIINVLRYNDNINNKTALPNRVYNSVIYGRPMFAFNQTFLSNLVKTYNLGLVIDSFFNLENNILSYIDNIDIKEYNINRKLFMQKIIDENLSFNIKIKNFINN